MRKKLEPKQPIIIKKVIHKGHGGHHGGAWKVAYADFMTSLLALFIVLWVIGQDQKVRQAVAEYFQNPDLTPKQIAARIQAAEQALQRKAAQSNAKMPSGKKKKSGPEVGLDQKNSMVKLKEQLFEVLARLDVAEETRKQITIDITDEGLRISLVDRADAPFFEVGGAEPLAHTRRVLSILGRQLGPLPNRLIIEGHTDARPFLSKHGAYTNWELSADRANATRRFLLHNGVRWEQVYEVRGYADQSLHNAANPMDHRNRRVAIIVKYLEKESLELPAGTTGSSSGPEKRKPSASGSPTPEASPGGAASPGHGAQESASPARGAEGLPSPAHGAQESPSPTAGEPTASPGRGGSPQPAASGAPGPTPPAGPSGSPTSTASPASPGKPSPRASGAGSTPAPAGPAPSAGSPTASPQSTSSRGH